MTLYSEKAQTWQTELSQNDSAGDPTPRPCSQRGAVRKLQPLVVAPESRSQAVLWLLGTPNPTLSLPDL